MYARVWPEAREMVHRYAPDAELVWTGADDHHYWRETAARWGIDDLVTIEQDNAIHEDVIPQFAECKEPWCAFGYPIGTALCYTGGGCRKLSLEAQQRVTVPKLLYPDLARGITDIGACPDCAALCWRHMDSRIMAALQRAGYTVHEHKPDIRHLRMET